MQNEKPACRYYSAKQRFAAKHEQAGAKCLACMALWPNWLRFAAYLFREEMGLSAEIGPACRQAGSFRTVGFRWPEPGYGLQDTDHRRRSRQQLGSFRTQRFSREARLEAGLTIFFILPRLPNGPVRRHVRRSLGEDGSPDETKADSFCHFARDWPPPRSRLRATDHRRARSACFGGGAWAGHSAEARCWMVYSVSGPSILSVTVWPGVLPMRAWARGAR